MRTGFTPRRWTGARALSAACAVACCAAVAVASGQPSFRAATDLVVIDMVALDRDGRFVADLTPDEIEVKEDGKRQPVQLLRVVGAADTSSSPATPGTGISQPAETMPRPADSGGEVDAATRRLAIVIDTLSLSIEALPRVREGVLEAIDDLPTGLPVALVTIDGDLVVDQPFTTDRDLLRAAVRIFDAVDRACAATSEQRRVVEIAVDAGEQAMRDAQARSAAASEALARLVTRLGALDGRKHLVFYSSGHAISPLSQSVDAIAAARSACIGLAPMQARRDATTALGRIENQTTALGLREVVTQANRAQVTFYSVDPAGVTTSTIMPSTRGTAQAGGQGPLFAYAGLRGDAGRDYVEGLALETGGLTVKSNDMAQVLRQAVDDARRYYLIGYTPPQPGAKAGLRKITVSIKRRGLSVRYRNGYLAAPSAVPATSPASDAERAIDGALDSPERYASEAIVVTPTVQDGALSIEVLVPHASITWTDVDGQRDGAFAVHAVVRPEGTRAAPIDVPGKDISLRFSPEEYARLAAAGTLRVVLSTAAPKGLAQVVVAVRDAGGWLATRVVPCCAAVLAAGGGAVEAAPLLAQGSDYVDAFVARFSNVVMEETLTQTYTPAPSTLGGRYSRVLTPGTTTTRRLRSDFLLVRPPSTVFWLAFRDVVEVDGRAVADREHRLEQLFLQNTRSGLAEAQRIAAAGAAHFLGPRTRTTTSPVFALAFLQPHHQARFVYSVEPAKGGTARGLRTLVAREVQEPTLLRTDTGGNLPIRARYEIEEATGVVRASELSLTTLGEQLLLRTTYARDERVQGVVPETMREEHVTRDGARLVTTARYGRVRTFGVTTSEVVP
jgi:VWFA-related protein